MRLVQALLLFLTLALLVTIGPAGLQGISARAASDGPSSEAGVPSLSLPQVGPVQPGASVTLPVTFASGGSKISSLVYSIDYDPARLSFDPADNNSDGLPDAINFGALAGFSKEFTLDAGDPGGELDFAIADYSTPLGAIPDGGVVSITFTALNPGGTSPVTTAVSFSSLPAASFGDTNGQSVPGTTSNGSVLIVPPTPPAAPTGLTAAAVSTTQINLSWVDNANNEDGFKIERCQGENCASFAQIATVGVNVQAYFDTTAASGTSYSYRVRATNAAGDSAYSNTASAKTPKPETPPVAPTGLTATAVSATRIDLAWVDQSNNEDGFKIERCEGIDCGSFAQIAVVGANVQAYADANLKSNTHYSYRVRATNSIGDSAYSNTAGAKTPSDSKFMQIFLPFSLRSYPPVYTVAGRVVDRYNYPVSGVKVSAGGGLSATTDSNGNYSFLSLPAGAYTLAPAKLNYTFTPMNRTVSVPPDSAGQDFVADLIQVYPPGCYEAVSNGGFETQGYAWNTPSTGFRADWSNSLANSGDFSMRTGILNAGENLSGPSSAYQLVNIPRNTISATLRFYVYQISGEPASLLTSELLEPAFGDQAQLSDRQKVVMTCTDNNTTADLFSQLRNTGAWVYREIVVPRTFYNQTIKLDFVTANDGRGGITAMYVDDVSLIICR